MDRRERFENLHEALLAALDGFQAKLWTALPAIIESFDADAMTVTAQPAIQARVLSQEGDWQWTTLPLLVDVPVIFPSGGGYTLTFPIALGDECLVLFSSRCLDAWWQSGGVQVQADVRMHDLSDGIALVGMRSQPRVLDAVSLNSTQLRSDDGTTYVEVKAGQVVNVVAPGAINLTTDGDVTITAGGQVTVDSPLLRAQLDIVDRYPDNARTIAGMRTIFDEHTHGGVVTGDDDTDVPNELMD